MTTASFALQGYNPDVLSCIANLSNDEVFTPPEVASQILDTLQATWAKQNNGENLWTRSDLTFLDPCAKSGVFLREIVKRLSVGLTQEIPDLTERVNHIVTKQVFGIGITELTSLITRRSVYCSKRANGIHSIARTFSTEEGNIWFERTDHSWIGSKCQFCSVRKDTFDRGEDRETYAYKFIHLDEPQIQVPDLFGEKMKFDVVIGNPPYQMKDGAGGTSDSLIFHLFVEQAMKLEPRYLSMVIPSRWFAGGRGLDGFRQEMLSSKKLIELVDYPVSKEVFPSVEIMGGVSYFLYSPDYRGECRVTINRGGESVSSERKLDEYDVFIRDIRSVQILRKVLKFNENSITEILTPDTPFGIPTNFLDFHKTKQKDDITLYFGKGGKRDTAFVARKSIQKNAHLIDNWKVLVPEARGGGKIPDAVLGKPWIAPPKSACTQTFLAFWVESEVQAKNLEAYYQTRFFRHLVSLRKVTQHALRSTYFWVPKQDWNEEWTDEKLYEKYGLTKDEISYIESMVRVMENNDDQDD
jgi:site-specific DNA-methyltransferase (adenine-specific)